MQQRSGRKCITTVQGLADDLDLKRILKAFKKNFRCDLGCGLLMPRMMLALSSEDIISRFDLVSVSSGPRAHESLFWHGECEGFQLETKLASQQSHPL